MHGMQISDTVIFCMGYSNLLSAYYEKNEAYGYFMLGTDHCLW